MPAPTLASTIAARCSIRAMCRACRRVHELDVAALAALFGDGLELQALRHRLRCQCGSRSAELTVHPVDLGPVASHGPSCGP